MKKKRVSKVKQLEDKVFEEKLKFARLEGMTEAYVSNSIRVQPYSYLKRTEILRPNLVLDYDEKYTLKHFKMNKRRFEKMLGEVSQTVVASGEYVTYVLKFKVKKTKWTPPSSKK